MRSTALHDHRFLLFLFLLLIFLCLFSGALVRSRSVFPHIGADSLVDVFLLLALCCVGGLHLVTFFILLLCSIFLFDALLLPC